MRLPVLAVALVSSAISDTAVAQSAPGNPMVQWYASEYGVAATEAEARLARLSSIAAVEKELQERFPNQFGGLYVQHSPQFRVVVKMTGAGQGLLQQVTSDPIYVVEQAERPLMMLRQLKDRIARELASAQGEYSVSVDVWKGTVDIKTTNEASLRGILAPEIVRREYVTVEEVPAIYRPAATIYGGVLADGTTDCTVGYTVNSLLGQGILTAGHCPNTMTISGLTFQTKREAWKTSYDFGFDMQLMMPSSTHTYPNQTYSAPSTLETITQVYGAGAVPLNWPVCMFGRATNARRCGLMTAKWVDLRESVSGIVNTVFIANSDDGRQFVKEGDSGGPVLGAGTAYGIVKGYINTEPHRMIFVDVLDALAVGGLEADVVVKTSS